MAQTPTIPIEVFVSVEDGSETSHGVVDFMPAFAEIAARSSVSLSDKIAKDDGIFVRDVISVLPKAVHEDAWNDKLALHGLRDALAATFGRIGLEGFVEAHRVNEAARELRFRLERAKEELEHVRTARWDPSDSEFGMLYSDSVGSNEGFINEGDNLPSEMLNAAWESYNEVERRPDTGYGSPEVAAWNARLVEWTRREMPPYVFGTTEDRWNGITPDLIRSYMDDHGLELRIEGVTPVVDAPAADADDDPLEPFHADSAVEAILDNEMCDHHEDAIDQVKDQDGLYEVVGQWARTGDDAALEAGLAAWNAKQGIISYMADKTVIVPVYPDVTYEEAVAYCEARVVRLQGGLEAVLDSYRPPVVAEAEEEVAAAPSP